jgi:CDP-4-dehydro-6-deoxyglucose reductase
MILLAGGTGFAPIKAIVEHAIAEKCQRPMFIYWGAKARVDLYQNALPEAMGRRARQHHLCAGAFRAGADDAWTGRTGFVHQAVLVDHPIYPDFQVYACGSPA